MNPRDTEPPVTVFSSADAPALYVSRLFWEEKFRQMGIWPPMLAYDVASRKHSSKLDAFFPEFQLIALERGSPDRVAGVAHAVPLWVGDQIADLPETGWDWALETAMAIHAQGAKVNALCGLSITVLPEAQRRGIGNVLISRMLTLAAQFELSSVVMPVRPISKEQHPRVPMNDFKNWHRDDGLHYDAWVRTHQKSGARILTPCNCSMTVVAPISDWRLWANQPLLQSGDYLVKGCLAPVHIDTSTGVGTYFEPNLWMRYRIN